MKTSQRRKHCPEDLYSSVKDSLKKAGDNGVQAKEGSYGLHEVEGQELKLSVLIRCPEDFVFYLIGNEEPPY